jgi:hypothetical protein
MLLALHQNVRKNRDMKITNRSKFKYLGMTVINQNVILE